MGQKTSVNISSIKQALQLVALLACMAANSGCYYYKSVGYDRVGGKPKKFCRRLRSSLTWDKYVIVHQGNKIWHLSNMALDLPPTKLCFPDYQVMYGGLEEVDSPHIAYYNKYREKNRRAVRYLIADEDYVLDQVHVYVGENNSWPADSVSLPISSINRIEVYNQATGRTSWTWAALNICFDVLLSSGSHKHNQTNTHNSQPRQTTNVHHGPRSK